MVAPKRRIKLFNRLLKEFIEDYNNIYNLKINIIKTDDISLLNTFKDEINFVSEKFFNCDEESFSNISLCKKIGLDKTNMTNSNDSRLNIWKYMHNLYILTLEATDKQPVVEKSKKALDTLSQSIVVKNITKPKVNTSTGNQMDSLIENIAGQVSKSLEGKDLSNINPMDLLSSLMSGGESNLNGIDFGSILKNTTELIQNKVNSGEIDLETLKDQATSLMSQHSNPEINNDLIKHLKN